ncbi:hypothetical protein EVAR_26836_1 [Eumeta japonica]|uniref:Uncharacterized protein n=1 Tax=Eumeta variegata TaxID=151549 RepID=A0A4C1VWH5_EUMVA|nr:hypothetical protein EVAR_26836_1 [Eumeta japonica]
MPARRRSAAANDRHHRLNDDVRDRRINVTSEPRSMWFTLTEVKTDRSKIINSTRQKEYDFKEKNDRARDRYRFETNTTFRPE